MTNKIKLTKHDVLHVAKLAQLSLTPQEGETYTKQLEEIIQHIHQLDKVDVSNVPSTTHPIDLQNITFEDGKPSQHQLKILTHLKTKHIQGKTYFVVDRVL